MSPSALSHDTHGTMANVFNNLFGGGKPSANTDPVKAGDSGTCNTLLLMLPLSISAPCGEPSKCDAGRQGCVNLELGIG